ncbi:MAG: amidohydrolase [Phycisphaerales bacterium]
MSIHHARPPRLREAHAHLAAYGQSLGMPSLAHCESVEECLQHVHRACTEAGQHGFVRFTSARVGGWAESRWPTLREMDQATGMTRCVIMSFDHHCAAANSSAMSVAGLQPGVAVPPNGVVELDPATGAATGMLYEEAAYAAWNAAPEPTATERVEYVRSAARALAALGFVEVHDLHSQPWLMEVLLELDRAGELPVSVWLYPPAAELPALAPAWRAIETSRVRLAGGKIFADGTLNSRTAHLIHRYVDPLTDAPRGRCMIAPAALDEQIRIADGLDLPLAVHAIGDGAVRMVLDCIERVKPRTMGHRIEHCELIDRMDVPRFAALGVTCSVQPCHLLSDVEVLNRSVIHRLARVLPLRELLESGLVPGHIGTDGRAGLVFGSDVPIVRANPEDSIQAAVKRRRESAPIEDAIAFPQALSEEEAWGCFACE